MNTNKISIKTSNKNYSIVIGRDLIVKIDKYDNVQNFSTKLFDFSSNVLSRSYTVMEKVVFTALRENVRWPDSGQLCGNEPQVNMPEW